MKIDVVMHEMRWTVVREGSTHADSVHDTLAAAVSAARQLGARLDARVEVYDFDGRPKPPGHLDRRTG